MATKDFNHTWVSKRDVRLMTCSVCGLTKQVGSSQRVPPVCYSVPIVDEVPAEDG